MTPGTSVMVSALCGDGATHPRGAETRWDASCQYDGFTEAETGAAPPVVWTCEERPVCQSCAKIRPPLACTASTILLQPSTCSSEYKPGAPNHPRPVMEMVVASEIIRPPSEARCV